VILPDANLLIAFTWANHPNEAEAREFFVRNPKIATCPLTELAMVRVWMQMGASPTDADKALSDFVAKYRSVLIPADISATQIAGSARHHKDTTDTYLVKLAQQHGIKLATLDAALSKRFPGSVEFIG
jgi:uncharacterized protein